MIYSIKMDNHAVTYMQQIATHVVEHFQHLFNNASILQYFSLMEELIPNLINY